ncbi:sugar ABC transporter permease [Paenibacillus validus]|uniref:ABC transporter permease subunit n=1 Tax=Paenibacillus validus TaxID=44253 RepID=A0A7X2ZA97_9BACL|nr:MULTISPECIES: sugar ABC transporter permease [Paenibacillus]MED4603516.1 sugar ABC transporter permease [Paenibacillus validus]MED4605363.1 sugar ABC transporter permease [Paenibacillus validus]MUG71235.1 ABC transporter permease subunit [Paenibacillus validus]
MQYSWFDRHLKWIYTLPAVLFVLLMMLFPIIYTVRISFFEWSMSATTPPKWVGLANYYALLQDERFWHAVGSTFYFTLVALAAEVILGVAIAMLLSRNFIGKNLVKTVFLLPMVATPVAMGLVWMLIYEPTIGVANMMLKSLGFEPLLWLASPSQVIPSLIIIDVWEWTPMIALIVMAGIATLPSDPYEAADVDGASAWRKFVSITLPLLRPTILVATMLRLIDVLKTFDIIYATTQGGPNFASETLNLYGYVLGFQYFKLGMASALLVLFFLLVMGLTLLMIWMRKRLEGAK